MRNNGAKNLLSEYFVMERKCQGLRVEQLAVNSGVSESNILDIETGYTEDMSGEILSAVAESLGFRFLILSPDALNVAVIGGGKGEVTINKSYLEGVTDEDIANNATALIGYSIVGEDENGGALIEKMPVYIVINPKRALEEAWRDWWMVERSARGTWQKFVVALFHPKENAPVSEIKQAVADEVEVQDGIATLYKGVDDDYSTDFARAAGISYAPGSTPTAPDWNGGAGDCGGGLHFSPTPSHALFYNRDAAHFVACPVRVDEIAVYQHAILVQDKVKAPRVCAPCYEVDIYGRRIGDNDG